MTQLSVKNVPSWIDIVFPAQFSVEVLKSFRDVLLSMRLNHITMMPVFYINRKKSHIDFMQDLPQESLGWISFF